MKIIGITLGTLLLTALIWLTLHFWGQGLQYQPYDHPMMNIEGAVKAINTDRLQDARLFIKNNPKGGIYLRLHMSSDGVFFTSPAESFAFLKSLAQENPSIYKGNKHFYYDFAFLKSQAPEMLTFEEWMSLKPRFWIFDLQDNALGIDKFFVEVFEKNHLESLSIIRSDIDLIVSSLKEKRPLWIYGSTLSDLNKMLTLGSIGLQGIANFQRDIYFSPLEIKDRSMININVLQEIRKRFKKIALGPLRTDSEINQAEQLKPDIFIINDSASDKKTDP